MQSAQCHGLPPGVNGDPRGSSPGKPGRGVATLPARKARPFSPRLRELIRAGLKAQLRGDV